jgi:crotonobetainyl-CoA:carnitine CoA-transferase CaiB-like acyl-CoA transferase
LDYEGLKTENPKLIYCSVTGFGQDGPYASRAGYDFLIQGMSGIMSLTGKLDGVPQKWALSLPIFSRVYTASSASKRLLQSAIPTDEINRLIYHF